MAKALPDGLSPPAPAAPPPAISVTLSLTLTEEQVRQALAEYGNRLLEAEEHPRVFKAGDVDLQPNSATIKAVVLQ